MQAVTLRRVVGAACALAFVAAALLVRADATPLVHPDTVLAERLHHYILGHRAQLPFWRGISTTLAPVVLRIVAVLAGALLWWRGRRSDGVLVAVAVLGTALLSPVTKVLVDRDRPHLAHAVAHAGGQSYPSGHALTSLVAAGVLVLVCTPRARRVAVPVAAALVFAVGLSRLVLGVHYLSDVIGGWLLGTAWVCLLGEVPRRRPLISASPSLWSRFRPKSRPQRRGSGHQERQR